MGYKLHVKPVDGLQTVLGNDLDKPDQTPCTGRPVQSPLVAAVGRMIVVFPHPGYAQEGNVVVAVGLQERLRLHQFCLHGTLGHRLGESWW